ncbi:MAG: hypothetical protein KF816_17060 [Melioribacteraceae bacterium]|nr:hypothetical protein [Melioribacteraceae bacterium]
MSNPNISEIDALKIVDDTLSKVSEQDGKKRIIEWIISKYFNDSNASFFEPTIEKKKRAAKNNKPKKQSKVKASYSIIKDMILKPKNKKSLRDFVNDKKPSNHKEKIVVCIYYLTKTLEKQNVNINHIYTCYKDVDWKVPKDFKNMLHQAGSEGWLDTKEGENLLVTPIGENLVEHDLPRKEKVKNK